MGRLEDNIRWAFGSSINYISARGCDLAAHCDTAYIEIPLSSPQFEVPVFAMMDFDRALEDGYNGQEAIVARLRKGNLMSRYSSINRIMQDVICSTYKQNFLVPVAVTCGNDEVYYFATQGAVFTRHLHPLVMCSWIVEWTEGNDQFDFRLIRPIMRVDPECYVNKSNPMEKFIVNKMMPAVLDVQPNLHESIDPPSVGHIADPLNPYEIKVEICKSPFIMRRPGEPSISTTTGELVQTAINHFNEII